MRDLYSLGISQAPWHTDDGRVWNNDGWLVYDAPYRIESMMPYQKANARLIAASPKLYEALREAVIRFCHDCRECDFLYGKCYCRAADKKCFVMRWRRILDEASGEAELLQDNNKQLATNNN